MSTKFEREEGEALACGSCPHGGASLWGLYRELKQGGDQAAKAGEDGSGSRNLVLAQGTGPIVSWDEHTGEDDGAEESLSHPACAAGVLGR
jgi:hypothetical protein